MDRDQAGKGPLKAAEFVGRILSNGTLEIPALIRHELQLRAQVQVKVILLREEDTPEEQARLAAQRAEAFRQIDEFRGQLSGKKGNLTEALLQAREADDAARWMLSALPAALTSAAAPAK